MVVGDSRCVFFDVFGLFCRWWFLGSAVVWVFFLDVFGILWIFCSGKVFGSGSVGHRHAFKKWILMMGRLLGFYDVLRTFTSYHFDL